MKILKLLSMVLLALVINSCNDDDNNNDNEPGPDSWKLVNVSGGIAGTNDEFPEGTITWTFNDNGTISVVNNNTDDQKVDFMDSGTYNFAFLPNTVTPQSCNEALVIDGTSFGCQNITGDTMTLNQVESDGYLLTLVRT